LACRKPGFFHGAFAIDISGDLLAVYDCSSFRKLIDASLDRELEIKEALGLQTHLTDCAECREILLDERDWLALIQSAGAPTPAPERTRLAVQDALSWEVDRTRQRRQRLRALMSPRMLAALAALALFFVFPRAQVPDVVKIALAEHRASMTVPHGLHIKTSDATVVRTWLNRRLPFTVHVPTKAGADLRLLGATVRTGPTPAAVLTYDFGGAPISLLVAPPRTLAIENAHVMTFRNVVFHSARLENRHVLQWSDRRHTYVLVACREIPVESLPIVALADEQSSR
jgi:anti-sigma factor RsiW